MADYHSPTVVSPSLPLADISPLEQLILGQVFDTEPAGKGLVYFHSWSGAHEFLSVEVGELRAAYAGSVGTNGVAHDIVTTLLDRHAKTGEGGDDIEIDLSIAGFGWERILQDIIRRSSGIDEITVTTSFTCTKMRPDGFGGMITRITAEAIESGSISGMLERMREERPLSCIGEARRHECHDRLQAMADAEGWTSSTLLLLIANWLETNRHAAALIDHLDRLASAGND